MNLNSDNKYIYLKKSYCFIDESLKSKIVEIKIVTIKIRI